METRAHYVLIGAFVLAGAAALMLFVVWISQSPFNRSFDTYDVLFEGPVNGLSEGGEVRFNGIKVGEVKKLTLDPRNSRNVIARIQVDARTPVLADSVAQLDFLGVTGVTFIQIRAGAEGQPLLREVSKTYPPLLRTERTALDMLFMGGQDFLSVSQESLAKVNDILSDENVEHISGILANVEIATGRLAAEGGLVDSATRSLQSIERAAGAVDRAARSIDKAAVTLEAQLQAIGPDATAAAREAAPALAEARAAIGRFNASLGAVEGDLAPRAGRAIEQLAAAASDLRTLMIRLDGLASDIEQDPSRFIYQRPLPVE